MGKREYLFTERAHLMCPNMFFGIKFTIRSEFNMEQVNEAFLKLEDAHPFLKSLIEFDKAEDKYYYAFHEDLHIPITQEENADLWEQYYIENTSQGWNVCSDPLLKVITIPDGEQFVCIFIAHHLLGDGRAILDLVCEFADCYVQKIMPSYVEEHLLKSQLDLPKGSGLPFISRILIDYLNKKWTKENHFVSYEEYLTFERQFVKENPRTYKVEMLSKTEVANLHTDCKKRNFSINDYLVAQMMLTEHINKVIIAADIRKELSSYQPHALGNYATAFSVVCKSKSQDCFHIAADVSKQIKKMRSNPKKQMLILACYFRMIPQLLDSVAISSMGNFKSEAGNFAGTKMFGYGERKGYSITNLGNINNSNILEAVLIPPASPANHKTMGVLSVNGRMNKCTVIYTNDARI